MYCSPLACCVLFTLACCVLFTLACCVLFTLACCVLFTLSSFVFCMFIFKPVLSASCVNLLDFFYICLCVCDSRQIFAKSRSSNCLVNVHWMSFWPCLTVSLITQSITMITINGDRVHPCLTPVFTSNVSDSFPLWITWQVEFLYICWISVTNFAGIP